MPMNLRAAALAAVSSLSLLAAVPALAEDVTVTGITAGDGYSLSVPSVTATGTNLTEAEIRRLFTGDFPAVAGKLADLDAGQILVPEITLVYDIPAMEGQPAQKATVTYKDLELDNVVDGVAGTVRVGSSTVASAELNMDMGAMSADNFDIGAMLSFYGMGGATSGEDFRTVYSNFVFDGATLSSPAGFTCTIGAASIESFEARPLKTDIMAFTKLAMETEGKQDVPPETIRKLVDFYIDIFTAFRSTPMSLDGFDCTVTDPKEGTVKVSSGSLDYGAFEPGVYPPIGINNLSISVVGPQAGSISLGNFTWKSMDFNGAIAALKAAATLDEAWFTANWRKLIPVIEGLSVADLAIDVPNPEGEGRFAGSLGGFDISLANYVNGLPSSLSISTDSLAIEVPDAEEGKLLRALGVTELNLTEKIALHWDEAAKTIVVDSLSIDDANLGRITVSGVIGNATDALFADDPNIAMVAATNLTLKEITFDLDDRGLSSLLIAVTAAEQNQEPAALRVGLAGLVQSMVLGLVGTTPEAMAASEEVANFVKTNPKLTLTLSATDEAGLPLPLLMQGLEDPSAFAGRIAIKAKSGGDARPVDQAIALPEGGMMSDDDMTERMTPPDQDAPMAPEPPLSETQESKRSLKN